MEDEDLASFESCHDLVIFGEIEILKLQLRHRTRQVCVGKLLRCQLIFYYEVLLQESRSHQEHHGLISGMEAALGDTLTWMKFVRAHNLGNPWASVVRQFVSDSSNLGSAINYHKKVLTITRECYGNHLFLYGRHFLAFKEIDRHLVFELLVPILHMMYPNICPLIALPYIANGDLLPGPAIPDARHLDEILIIQVALKELHSVRAHVSHTELSPDRVGQQGPLRM